MSKTHIYQEGILSGIQREGKSFNGMRFQSSHLELNAQQNLLLDKAIHGINAYPPKEREAMTPFQKKLITTKHQKNQRLINRWKQELTNNMINNLLLSLFPKSKVVKGIIDNYTTGKELNTLTFKELNITKQMLVEKLIEWKALPSNFYELGKTSNNGNVSYSLSHAG